MTRNSGPGKEMMTDQSGKPASKASNLQNRMAEMQRIAMAVHELAEDLKTVDCGLEISIGDTRAAMLFSAMLGLDVDEEPVTAEAQPAEESPNTPARLEDVAPEDEMPVELDRLTLPRVNMAALRQTQQLIFLDEIDSKKFLADNMLDGYLKQNVMPELIIRFSLGNPGEIFEVAELVDIFIGLGVFENKRFHDASIRSFRTSVSRVIRKLVACKFLNRLRGGEGKYGPLYRLNPDYDPHEPYIRHHFFGKISPYFHKKVAGELKKKQKTRFKI